MKFINQNQKPWKSYIHWPYRLPDSRKFRQQRKKTSSRRLANGSNAKGRCSKSNCSLDWRIYPAGLILQRFVFLEFNEAPGNQHPGTFIFTIAILIYLQCMTGDITFLQFGVAGNRFYRTGFFSLLCNYWDLNNWILNCCHKHFIMRILIPVLIINLVCCTVSGQGRRRPMTINSSTFIPRLVPDCVSRWPLAEDVPLLMLKLTWGLRRNDQP